MRHFIPTSISLRACILPRKQRRNKCWKPAKLTIASNARSRGTHQRSSRACQQAYGATCTVVSHILSTTRLDGKDNMCPDLLTCPHDRECDKSCDSCPRTARGMISVVDFTNRSCSLCQPSIARLAPCYPTRKGSTSNTGRCPYVRPRLCSPRRVDRSHGTTIGSFGGDGDKGADGHDPDYRDPELSRT